MTREVVLKAYNLVKRFGNIKALDNVSISIRKGDTKVIVGPNGAGKSTLLKCLNLLIRPDKGNIWFKNIEITSPNVDIKMVRRRIGFVFQEINLFRHLTVLKNVMIGLTKVKGLPKDIAFKKAIDALNRVEIDRDLWYRYPAQLSGGQRQRVAIARALAMEPDIILYDEPTSSLDPRFAGEVLRIIKDLARDGMTSLIVTHEIGFAKEIADEILFMYKGRIIEKGSPNYIITNPRTTEARKFFKESKILYGAGLE